MSKNICKLEREKILFDWNNTYRDYPKNETLNTFFEKQAAKCPKKIALIDAGHNTLSYETLNHKANQLARHLRNQEVKNEEPIAISIDRKNEVVIAILGVIKAGATYVPMETDWPIKRLEAILIHLKIKILITETSQLKMMQQLQWRIPSLIHIICLDSEEESPQLYTENSLEKVRREWDDKIKLAEDDVIRANFISSYTGLPFTKNEVKMYQNYIVNLASKHLSKNSTVLEIGCGSGLIMYPLAKQIKQVVATDPSPLTQKFNQAYIRKHEINNIELKINFAHEISQYENNSFDMIVLASTVQFFPSYAYLENIMIACLLKLKKDGILLIADVMDLRKQEKFSDSLVEFQRNNASSLIRTKTDLSNELYIDENFFAAALRKNNIQKKVDILHRKQFKNELRFRYDVMINNAEHVEIKQYDEKKLYTIEHIQKQKNDNLDDLTIHSSQLAYIIHTSGSTGQPKGVMIQHRAVVNLINWVNSTFKINSNDRILSVASICFDLSVYDIFGLLAAGGTIRMASKDEIRDPELLATILKNEKITFWNSAPQLLNQLLSAANVLLAENTDKKKLRLFFLSGDWIPLSLPKKIRALYHQAKIISLGGATEAAIWSNFYAIKHIDPRWVSIPYGKPIQNATYYILDNNLQPCSIGMAGDLYIGGDCLALGYKNTTPTDQARFIHNPYQTEEDKKRNYNARLYQTGDRASFFSDGNIQFLGRKDNQTKIRGVRVECGEIEAVLKKHPKISDAIVLVQEIGSEKQLIAYVISESCNL